MDVPLESYTVYIPKTRASDPTYIGTRNSVDFYYGKYSSYSVATESEEINSRTLLQTWATGAANLILCFGPLEYTIPFTVIAAAIGSFPSNTYIVGEGDFFLYYHRVEANCYGVYSKSGSDYRMWLSLENGTIRPYTVYHYSGGSVSHNCDAKVAETDSYGDTNKQLIKAAAMYAEGVSAFYERLTALTQYYARE